MITKEDLVGFEHDWVFLDENSINVYKFSEDGSGVIYEDEENINFKWKINNKGFINITYNGLLFYLKLESNNENTYVFSYYKKNENNKVSKIKNITFIRKDLNKVEKQKNLFESPSYSSIYNDLKNDMILKILFFLTILISFLLILIIGNSIPILSSIKTGIKLLITLFLIIYINKKLFIISKLINEKYRDKIKNLLFN